MSIPFIEENDQTEARREHLEAIRALIGNVYPNKFERSQVVQSGQDDTITAILQKFAHLAPRTATGERATSEEIEQANRSLNNVQVRMSGRLAVPPRVMGKAAFVHLSDGVSRLQIYVRRDDVKEMTANDGRVVDGWELFGLLDHGDFIGVDGFLFVTKTGELSVHVRSFEFLAKALLPMPDKMHGISDPEIRQRQRYADLIAGSLKIDHNPEELTTRQVFERRSRVICEMRRFLDDHGYIEVETPMLTPIASGAAARPFKTHHNALDIDLYARIAPELYLKRLVVGGFEKVYELNRNFRNEGISTRHNPEFTMLEFYCAYMDAQGMMDFCEEMLRSVVYIITGHTHIRFGELEIDFSRDFERLTMRQAIAKSWTSSEYSKVVDEEIDESWLEDSKNVWHLAEFLEAWEHSDHSGLNAGLSVDKVSDEDEKATPRASAIKRTWQETSTVELNEVPDSSLTGRRIAEIFETLAEPYLIQPTFIKDFPKPISPLSKASPADPSIAERFELFIAGMEVANGFSELNDPVEQYERFMDQMQQRERGDEEAMQMDEDYLRALSYGMPPAAGIGIGIDRLAMLLTNRHSIRDVILFPHMRPQSRLLFQKELEELREARRDFDRAVEHNSPDKRERGERCVQMAQKLMNDVNDSPAISGFTLPPKFSPKGYETLDATRKHAYEVLADAKKQLEEVSAKLDNLK